MFTLREPSPALAPFVGRLWYADSSGRPAGAARERVLPAGCSYLVLRLDGAPIRVLRGADDEHGASVGRAALCGVRSSYYLRDASRPSCSIGVQFKPGGANVFLGVPEGELAGRHHALEDLWGRGAQLLEERLLAAASPEARFGALESELLRRAAERTPLHPAVRYALARFQADPAAVSIRATARAAGLSQRRLIELFRRAVGLTPKVYCRMQRFQRLVVRAARVPRLPWAALAQDFGFYDQAHLTREFQAFAGCAPGAYAPIAADRPHHFAVAKRRALAPAPRGRSAPPNS